MCTYTLTPAIASGVGETLGSLVPCTRADIVVLDRNIYSIPPMEIIEANIALTILDGRVVYRSHSFLT